MGGIIAESAGVPNRPWRGAKAGWRQAGVTGTGGRLRIWGNHLTIDPQEPESDVNRDHHAAPLGHHGRGHTRQVACSTGGRGGFWGPPADVETDKATMELQAFDDGKVASIAVQEGETVPVGSVILVLAEDGESLEDAAGSSQGASGGSEKASKAASGGSDEDSDGGGVAVAAPPKESDSSSASAHRRLPVLQAAAMGGRRLARSLGRSRKSTGWTWPRSRARGLTAG